MSGVTWTSFLWSHAFGYVSHGGVGSLSTGHPAVEVLAEAPRLNVQSGDSKVLHQGSRCAALGPHS